FLLLVLVIVVIGLNAGATNLETLVLRPDGTDSTYQLDGIQGASTHHEAVDEAVSDGNTTRIFVNNSASGEGRVTFTLQDHGAETGTVEEIYIVTEVYRTGAYTWYMHILNNYLGSTDKQIFHGTIQHHV
ncbi:unnamed protein product, partial [marine sediment metagenome]